MFKNGHLWFTQVGIMNGNPQPVASRIFTFMWPILIQLKKRMKDILKLLMELKYNLLQEDFFFSNMEMVHRNDIHVKPQEKNYVMDGYTLINYYKYWDETLNAYIYLGINR